MTGVVASSPWTPPTQPCPECDGLGVVLEPGPSGEPVPVGWCTDCDDHGTVPARLPAELWLAHPPATPNDVQPDRDDWRNHGVQVGDKWLDHGRLITIIGHDDRISVNTAEAGWTTGTRLASTGTLVERAGHPWPYTPARGVRVGLCNDTGAITHTATVVEAAPVLALDESEPEHPGFPYVDISDGDAWHYTPYGDGWEPTLLPMTQRAGVWVPGGTATLLCDLTAVTDPGGCPVCRGDFTPPDHRIEGASKSCQFCNRTFTFNFMRDRGPFLCGCERALDHACPLCRRAGRLSGPWLPDGQPRPTTPRWTPIGDAA